MTPILSTLKKSGRAALVVLALGSVSLTAMPAMAQNFNFSFGITGGDENFSFSVGKRGERIRRACLTNNEIRRGLRREGFDDIRFRDRRGNRVTVTAENRRWEYTLRVHRCSGKVSIVDRDRKDRRDRRSPGFGLHLQF